MYILSISTAKLQEHDADTRALHVDALSHVLEYCQHEPHACVVQGLVSYTEGKGYFGEQYVDGP